MSDHTNVVIWVMKIFFKVTNDIEHGPTLIQYNLILTNYIYTNAVSKQDYIQMY